MKKRKAAKAAAKEQIRQLHEVTAARLHAKENAKADALQEEMEKEMTDQSSRVADELARKRKKRMDDERDELARRQAERLRRREEHEKEVVKLPYAISTYPTTAILPPLPPTTTTPSPSLPLLLLPLPPSLLRPCWPLPLTPHRSTSHLPSHYPSPSLYSLFSLPPQTMLAKLHEASIEYLDELNAQVTPHLS